MIQPALDVRTVVRDLVNQVETLLGDVDAHEEAAAVAGLAPARALLAQWDAFPAQYTAEQQLLAAFRAFAWAITGNQTLASDDAAPAVTPDLGPPVAAGEWAPTDGGLARHLAGVDRVPGGNLDALLGQLGDAEA